MAYNNGLCVCAQKAALFLKKVNAKAFANKKLLDRQQKKVILKIAVDTRRGGAADQYSFWIF